MRKVCSSCGEAKDSGKDFSWRYKDRDIRNTRCRYCQSQVSKQHYKDNMQSYRDRVRTREALATKDSQRKLAEYLASHPCADCGQTDIRVLEFDRVRGKKVGNISRMVGEGYSWSIIETEIAKCEVRCANCHRIREGKKSGSWRQLFSL